MQSKDLQHETMRNYQTLIHLREDWSGALVLCCGSECANAGTPAAVSIAGGASLAVDSDSAAMKSAMRAGYLDFVVNTLDEALRTLKNEVRQHRPLSVGLIAEVDTTLGEMVERGVQPDLLMVGPNQSAQPILQNSSISALESRGMPLRVVIGPNDDQPAVFVPSSSGNGHFNVYLPAANAAELRTVDQRLLAILPQDDSLRRRWIQRVPQYLREARTGGRWIWLTQQERKQIDA